MATAAAKQLARIVTEGPWERPEQLPLRYLPGLHASPWHASAVFPGTRLPAVIAAIQAGVPSLQQEYRMLRDGGLLQPNTECIVSHNEGDRSGRWHSYEVAHCARLNCPLQSEP